MNVMNDELLPVIQRCHDFLKALEKEMRTIHEAPGEDRARMMAIMKMNIAQNIIQTWETREDFENDLAVLEEVLLKE